MGARIAKEELRRLRNEIPIAALIDHFEIPWKIRDGLFRFLCPLCFEYHTATNPKTNLARCFRCERNFNTIDLVVMMRKASFLDAVRYLRGRRSEIREPGDPRLA